MGGFRFLSSLKCDPRAIFLAASPLVSSAFGRPNEAPRRTREKTCGTQGNTSSKINTHWKALPVVGALFAATQDLVCLSGEKKKQKRFYL